VAPLPFNTWSGSYIGGRAFEYRASLQQVTESEGHPFFLAKRPGYEKMDLGGPFYTEKFKWEPNFPTKRFSMLGWYMEYQDGNIHTISPDQGAFNKIRTDVGRVSDSTLDSWGATAVSSTLPTKSKVDLVTSGVELFREGLPAMVGQGLLKGKLKDARKLGDELLNIEFGIKPLLGDIQGTAESIVNAAERIKQLERDSGRLVRRKFRFPDRDEYFHYTVNGAPACPNGWSFTYLWNDYSRNRKEIETWYSTKRWFSGAFTYHLDLGERQRNQLYAAAENARFLVGAKLDLETVWNLAPWTWLADWFGNMGDIMTNISHFSRDGLVMPYGYMMAEQNYSQRATSDLYWVDPRGPAKVVDNVSYTTKQRRPANPFGFGLSDMLLDTRQTSILAALGITRAPRK
jgi:hypothetical protein